MTGRKVVQISTSDGTFAVCEDGSAWCLAKTGDQWLRLPPIPQDEAQAVDLPATVRNHRFSLKVENILRNAVVALRDEGHATLGGELDLVLEAHLAGPTQPLLRSGQVTEEEAKRAVRVYMDNDSPDVEETWAAVLTDFLANRGINTEPAEFTDEQIDAAIEAWRKSGGGPSGMRAALRAAGARP